jgi:type II secretion system protein J
MRRANAGFTLLEILVAVGIAALLITAAVRSYVDIANAQQRGIEQTARDRIAELALDRMERELVASVLVVKPKDTPIEEHPWLFVGVDAVREARDADAMIFVTEAPAGAAGDPALEDARLVSYQIGPGELPEQLNLYRREMPMPAGMNRELPPTDGAPVLEGIAQFSLSFRDNKAGGSAQAWDSTAGPQANRLPDAVELKLQVFSRTPEGEQLPGETFARLVPLVVRPIGEDEEKGSGDCEGKPTIEECLKGLGLETGNLDQVLQGLQVEAGDCFSADDPRLSSLISSLRTVGPDPAEVCK